MSTISLCVIARDEEQLLPGLLASVEGVVDEVIVVDTGSCDRTVELARAQGAKVVSFEWINDFAAARNEALSHATCDYVLVLDADERLAEGDGDILKKIVEAGDADLVLLALYNSNCLDASQDEILHGTARMGEPILLPRLVRRTENLRWAGAVHETIAVELLDGMRVTACSDVRILHFGDVPEIREAKKKDDRNLALLEERCQVEPGNPVMAAHLARDYIRRDRLEDAWERVEVCWSHLEQHRQTAGLSPAVVGLATLRAHLLLAQGRNRCALEAVETGLGWGNDHPNLDLMGGAACEMIALETGGEEGISWLERSAESYVACLQRHGEIFAEELLPGATSWAASTRLGTVRLLQGRCEEALDAFETSLVLKEDHVEARLGCAEALLGCAQPEEALAVVEPCLQELLPDGWVIAAAACDVLGRVEEVVLLAGRGRDLAEKGFIAVHRRTCLEQLELACCIYGGSPVPGDGPVGLLGAVMSRRPEGANPWAGQSPDPELVTRVALNSILGGHSELLDALFEDRAEDLLPGVSSILQDALSELGVNVVDDGEPTYLFIGGAGRSGTTLVRAMLDAHSGIFCGPEVKLVPGICEMHKAWTEVMGDDFEASGIGTAPLDAGVRAFVDAVLREVGGDARCIAEKTPHNLLGMELLGRLFPRARFLHVVRDGRAVAASLVKQQWLNPSTGELVPYCKDHASAACYWGEMITEVRTQSLTVPDRYIEVIYEELVANPEQVMRKVLAFVGQPWEDAVVRHEESDQRLPLVESSSEAVSRAVNTDPVDRWRRELTAEQVQEIESEVGEVLAWLGYSDAVDIQSVG
jgi:tetratricopeptide (TPR) repeat protein